MSTPVILWRESLGYGAADFTQIYLNFQQSSNGLFSDPGVANSGIDLRQWGRGTGSDQGFAMRNDVIAVRATTIGFAGHVASGFGMCFAYNQGGNVGNSRLCEFYDDDALGNGSFSHGQLHLRICTLADGRVAAIRGPTGGSNTGTVIGTSTYVLPVGLNAQNGPFTWFNVIPVISSTNGSVLVYADGVLILNLTGVNTSAGGSNKVGYFQFCANGVSSGGNRIATDLLITDGSAVMPDCRVTYRHANTAGTLTAGTATGAGTLVGCVSETVMDGDTTYIDFDTTSLPKGASFTTNAMPANTVTIYEVSPLVIRRKSDSGTCTDRVYFKSNSTVDDGGVDIAVPSGYIRDSGVNPARAYPTDPHTSAAWLTANVDACEIGDKRTA